MRIIVPIVSLVLMTMSLVGCTNYQRNYYDISANQWQHMPSSQQNNTIYAYNSEQMIKAQNKTTLNVAGFELP